MREVLSADVKLFGAHVEFELQQQKTRIERLQNERRKLLQAHYGDAIPFDLFRDEQVRITNEMADAEARLATLRKSPEHSLQDMLDALVDLVRSSHSSYMRSGPIVRRLFNQAFFEWLEVAEDGQELSASRLAEPVDVLVRPPETELSQDREAAWDIPGGQQQDGATELVGGLNLNLLVGAEGLEPPAPSL